MIPLYSDSFELFRDLVIISFGERELVYHIELHQAYVLCFDNLKIDIHAFLI
jgi:hypothetical protein